jgi:hypothetical protein
MKYSLNNILFCLFFGSLSMICVFFYVVVQSFTVTLELFRRDHFKDVHREATMNLHMINMMSRYRALPKEMFHACCQVIGLLASFFDNTIWIVIRV